MENYICYLCGDPIEQSPKNNSMILSMDHVPPKQFYPKGIRDNEDLNLRKLPSHKKCNEDYKLDEEYFYHSMYPAVERSNPNMAKLMYEDLLRRSEKPQTQILARKLLQNIGFITKGGIHLPKGIVEFALDEYRIQRIVLKIAIGLLYEETSEYMPLENAKDIRLCLGEEEVPKLYQLVFNASLIKGEYQKVFSYKYFEFDANHLLCMLFWESFMFCVFFKSPSIVNS